MFNYFKKNKPTSSELQNVNSENEKKVTEIILKYSYDWIDDVPISERKPCNSFCAKLMELNRLYSRADIETISERLGYSVWDRRGAWIDMEDLDEDGNPIEHHYIKDGVKTCHCKHQWKAMAVTYKK